MRCDVPALLATLVASGLFVALCSGCGGSTSTARAPQTVRERIAAQVAAQPRHVPLELRYNPPRCACPAWEVQLDGRWYRALHEGSKAAKAAFEVIELAVRAEAAAGGLPRVYVKGTLDDAPRRCESGAYVLVVNVERAARTPTALEEPAP